VDINGDAECDIELPFLHQTPWYDSEYGFDYANMYNMTIEPITDIVSDEATETKPVHCAMWVSFPGLQVAGPVLGKSSIDSFTNYFPAMSYEAQGRVYEAQAVEMPGLGKCSVEQGAKWGMNDVPASIYHLAKRYHPAYTVSCRPWICPQTYGKVAAGNSHPKVYINDAPLYQFYALMFRFYRTSINVFSKGKGVIDDTAPFGEAFRGGSAPKDYSFGEPFALATMGVCNARIPFRASVSYLPTPTFSVYPSVDQTSDTTTGELKTFSVTSIGPANVLENNAYGDRIGTGGVTGFKGETEKIFIGAADDYNVHTFIGTPLIVAAAFDSWVTKRA
jgi:hypothetical protein